MYGHVMCYYIYVYALICHETYNDFLVVHMLSNYKDGNFIIG